MRHAVLSACFSLLLTVSLASQQPTPEQIALDKVRSYEGKTLRMPEFRVAKMEVGLVGRFGSGSNQEYRYEIKRIMGPDKMVMIEWLLAGDPIISPIVSNGKSIRIQTGTSTPYRKFKALGFILKGMPTAGLVDGREYLPQGSFRVTGTEQYEAPEAGPKTVFVVEPGEIDGKPTVAEYEMARKGLAEERALVEKAAALDRVAKEAQKKEDDSRRAQARSEADASRREAAAASKLKLIRQLIDDGKTNRVGYQLSELIKAYPGTQAAAQAKELQAKHPAP